MGNGVMAIGPKLPRPFLTLPNSIRDLEGAVGRAQQPVRLDVIERVAGTIQQPCYRSAPLNISGMTGSVKLN